MTCIIRNQAKVAYVNSDLTFQSVLKLLFLLLFFGFLTGFSASYRSIFSLFVVCQFISALAKTSFWVFRVFSRAY